MGFRIGQRVECIKEMPAVIQGIWPLINYPSLGGKYTVRGIFDDEHCESQVWILLEEIRNIDVRWGPNASIKREAAWPEFMFRPITDISALTQLTKVRELEDV